MKEGRKRREGRGGRRRGSAWELWRGTRHLLEHCQLTLRVARVGGRKLPSSFPLSFFSRDSLAD
jgi:hypothetical protein